MLKRVITGTGYVIVIAGFFLMREFLDARIFHLLTYFLIVAGTFEVGKMLRTFSMKGTFTASLIYSISFVPIYLIGDYFFAFGWLFALNLAALMIIAWCIYALVKGVETKTFLVSCLPFIYPSLLLLSMLLANDMISYGFIVLLLSFVISPLSDTFAYFVGSLIGGKKLCPKISPKKTWSGAIGGTIGGAIGGLIVYLVFKPQINFFSPVLFFILVGLVASIVNVFGDLFESYIKRKVGVKDSGNILPGHGGVLDRIDGTMFTVTFIYWVFLFL